jgi:hypothetical protein
MMYQPIETLQESRERAIVEGWARTAKEYNPRTLTLKEWAQVQRAELNERIAEKTPFVLGEPLYKIR